MLTVALESTETQKKHTMLPVLVVLFLVSYGLLTLLVVEQNRTITAQRSLIQQIMGDSFELNKLKAQMRAQHPGTRGQAQAGQATGPEKSRKLVPLKPPKNAADTPDVRRTPVSI